MGSLKSLIPTKSRTNAKPITTVSVRSVIVSDKQKLRKDDVNQSMMSSSNNLRSPKDAEQRSLNNGDRNKSMVVTPSERSRIPLTSFVSNSPSESLLQNPRRKWTVYTPTPLPPVKIVSSSSVSKSVPSKKITKVKGSTSSPEIPMSKLVTVIRMGPKPRKIFRVLLSSKTAPTLEHFMTNVTEKIQSTWGAVRKIYGLDGVEITSLDGFFKLENVFLACPNDKVTYEDRKLNMDELIEVQRYLKNPLKSKIPVPSSSVITSKSIKRGTNSIIKSQKRSTKGKSSSVKERKTCIENENSSSPVQVETVAENEIPDDHPKNIPVSDYPEMILSKFHVGAIIGDGNFAVVRECTRRINDEPYALKVIDKSKSIKAGCDINLEVQLLRKVRHTNIIKFYERFDLPEVNEYYMVMELVKGGDLYYAIKEVTKFSEEQSQIMLRDVASALAYLHSRAIVHRDIKPENLLIYTDDEHRMRLKLTDFGMATLVDTSPLYVICGTPTYVAPEIIMETGYGTKVDIWALGVLTYILLCGYAPFSTENDTIDELYVIIKAADVQFFANEWSEVSIFAKDVISRMIEKSSVRRYSARDVLEHPWLKKVMNTEGSRTEFNFGKIEQIGLNNAPSLFDEKPIPVSYY